MGLFERPLHPDSAAEILPQLAPSRKIHQDIPSGGTYIVESNDWPVWESSVFRGQPVRWFRTLRKMVGPAASLDKRAGGSIIVGHLGEDEHFGSISLNCDYSSEEVSFSYMLEDASLEPLEIASEGVLRYLQGYDGAESAEIAQRAAAIRNEERREYDKMLDWLINSGPEEWAV